MAQFQQVSDQTVSEQTQIALLRLLLSNTRSSMTTTIFLVIVMFVALNNPMNRFYLALWALLIIGIKLFSAWYSKQQLTTTISPLSAHRIIHHAAWINGLDGIAWGALTWLTLDNTNEVGQLIVLITLCGVACSSTSALAPIIRVVSLFTWLEFAVMAAKFVAMGDPQYYPIVFAGFLYIATLMGQARNHHQSAKNAIDLGFENHTLVEKLKIESENTRLALQQAEHANRAKSQFLASASHDLRQPIHAQGLLLDALATSPLTLQQQDILAKANNALQASADMLGTLLDYSHIEAGVIAPHYRDFHLQPLLHKIENDLAAEADAKGLFFRCRNTSIAVYSDLGLLERILRNLVSNAIRYTQQGGLLIACRQRGNKVWIEVWDTGIGIAPSLQEEIFSEFYQVDNPERDRHKGFGLGLAIVRQLADALDHPLQVQSRPGRGSVFKIRLPVVRLATYDTPSYRTPVTRHLNNLRVLMIDDDAAVREAMRTLLSQWGSECQVAENVNEALALCQHFAPDIIISDYRLRANDTGAKAITAIRNRLERPIPAILITGDTGPQRIKEALASGIPLIHKPISSAKLHQLLFELVHHPPA
ncbi:MAG: hybrid sensor histidine kinase/response regulator [Methylotenera sp.]|nr:hybrid sensor histidine kinase/response regulator [Methylotenera sp.]